MRRRRVALVLLITLVAFAIVAVLFIVNQLATYFTPLSIPSGGLAFTTNTRGHWDIAIYSPSTGIVLLTPDDGFHDYFASWDFRGERINFLSNRVYNRDMVATQVNPDGTWLHTLHDMFEAITKMLFENRLDWDPVYRQDGTMVWASLRNMNLDLYIQHADGDPVRLTNTGARSWFPAWSPDGSLIAFSSDIERNENIYIMNADGSNVVQVTTDSADDIHPFWSLDGSLLLFVSERDGELKNGALRLYAVPTADALEGRGEAAVTAFIPESGFEADARYTVDGSRVALMAVDGGRWVVRVMEVDETGNLVRESAQTLAIDGNLLFPVWRP